MTTKIQLQTAGIKSEFSRDPKKHARCRSGRLTLAYILRKNPFSAGYSSR